MVGRDRDRDRLHQARRDRFVAAQDVIGVDAQRPGRDLGGHARVAVAVTADPAARLQEGSDPRRPRPGAAGVRGRAGRAAGRRVERRVERPIQPRHDREQRGIEEGHRRPDLVERGRADDPQVRGAPQDGDLLAQPAADLAVLRGREARVVEPGEQDRAAAKRDQRGPPARLGRVGGEDRPDRQPGDERVQLRIRPAQPPQARYRVRDRIVEDPVARRALAPAQRPDATHAPRRGSRGRNRARTR